jgi:hypothetical protein
VRAWRAGAGNSSDAKIEGDWAGKRLVSASLGHDFDEDAVREVDVAQPSIGRLLSAEQDSLAAQMLVPLERVRLLGRIQAQKWEATGDGDVEAELWEVDGLRFLEISLFVTQDPVGAMQRLQQRATDGGLDITAAGQETKTTTVLRHLATRHTNAPPA